jgi:hypothetical protein
MLIVNEPVISLNEIVNMPASILVNKTDVILYHKIGRPINFI